jgi:glycerol-3-phosphate dehydrogenase
MRRDPSALLERKFDLLVIGAGIHGACIAWDACLRGLSVALVDQGDFGAATSANSLGVVHGGLRYLARGDMPRMLESIRERSGLLRIAPGLVEPLPVLIPTYSGVSRGRLGLGLALRLNDLISFRRNRGIEPTHALPPGRLLSREECLQRFPWFDRAGLTGGALWYDGRLRHPERLTLSFVRSAAERGAIPVNYLRVETLLVQNGVARGARVTDLEGGSQFEVGARSVIVSAGPWTSGLIAGTLGKRAEAPFSGRALAVNIKVSRALSSVAIGAQARNGPDEDPVCGGGRYLFATPQTGNQSLLGTWYSADHGTAATPETGITSLVREFNAACPGLELSPREVTGYHSGWLPLKGQERGRATALAERPRITDHGATDAVGHLLSVEGVKYTTARSVAQRVVDWVFRDLGRSSPPCRTLEVQLEQAGTDGEPSPTEVRRAVHQELAVKLGDIVFRRSGLGASGVVDRATVSEVARIAGAELGWDRRRQDAETEEVFQQRMHPAPVEEPVG